MHGPDLIPFYTESQFPCNPFTFITSDEAKVIPAIKAAIFKVEPNQIEEIQIKDNYIQIRSLFTQDGEESIYLDEFAILKAIIHTLGGFDQDIVSYRVINVNSAHRNIITIILYHLLP